MNYLFDIGHPAHVHLFRNLIWELERRGHSVTVSSKQNPIIGYLLDHYHIPYLNLRKKGGNLLHRILRQVVFNYKMIRIMRREKIDLAIGISITVPFASRFCKTISVALDDDDKNVTPLFFMITHFFGHHVLSPAVLQGDRTWKKDILYPGLHELVYLHPNRFTPDPSVLGRAGIREGETFFILRFNAFKAQHDALAKGLSIELKRRLVSMLESRGRVFITSEAGIEEEFRPYQINVNPEDMHSMLFYATLLIGDSQTMTTEAAILGTPAIRCNTFAGRLTVQEDLEQFYGLCYSFLPDQEAAMMKKINELLDIHDLKNLWKEKRERFLSGKIDVTSFLLWFLDNYPESISLVKKIDFDWRRFA